jgi:hypothetical protein
MMADTYMYRFVSFFAQLDNFKESTFLFLSSRGYEAIKSTPRLVTSARSLSKNEYRQLVRGNPTWERDARDKETELEEQKPDERESKVLELEYPVPEEPVQ